MPRRAPVLIALVVVLFARPAAAKDDAEDARALLATIAGDGDKAARAAAIEQLIELGPRVVPVLDEFLKRAHAASGEQRRAVLAQIKASVPDKSGRFQSPGREKAAAIRADDEFDWLAALLELPVAGAQPALGEVLADVAAIRALTRSKEVAAGKVVIAAAFADATLLYRDECGRQLRKMAPYSVPALIEASQAKKQKDMARYANYQLERIDRQDAFKALAAAEADEDLQIAMLTSYGAVEHREATPAVFSRINDDSPRVRAAARKAWLQYVSPPHPPPPKKRQLQLTGGRVADKATPVELNSLQLAEVELDKRTEELFAEDIDKDLVKASERIFAHYDGERAARDGEVFAAGKAKAESGDLPGAVEVYDRLLAEDPGRKERAEMAPTYLAYAEALAKAEKWTDAAAMYSKAAGLDGDAGRSNDALAAHYFALGKALEAEGKDGGAAFRKAAELKPEDREARVAAERAGAPPANRPRWMLYVGGAGVAAALVLLVLGLMRRGRR